MEKRSHAGERGRLMTRVALVASIAVLAIGCTSAAQTNTANGGSGDPAGTNPGVPEGTAPGTSVISHPPVPSAGCGTSTVGAVTGERRTEDVNGTERWFLLTTPPQHDGRTPVPLVFDFHGLGEGAQIHEVMSKFGELGTKEGFAVVQAQGTGAIAKWDTTNSPDNPDLAFFDTMLDDIEHQLCIDTSRIYSTGLSYGAIMTSQLICKRSEVFAAVAPVSGLQYPEPCDQTRKVPILTFHGTADPILRFNGGVDLTGIFGGGDPNVPRATIPPADLDGAGYPEHVRQWAQRYGCDPAPTDTKVGDDVIHRVYTCPPATPVEFFIIVGGGHAWPGSEFSQSIGKIVGPTSFTINATDEAWKFLSRYQLPA